MSKKAGPEDELFDELPEIDDEVDTVNSIAELGRDVTANIRRRREMDFDPYEDR